MGLGTPAPRELKLIEWGRPYGLLPSRFTPEDYYWLALAERLEVVRRLNEMYEDREGVKHLSRDAGLFIAGLRKEARDLIKESEDGDER